MISIGEGHNDSKMTRSRTLPRQLIRDYTAVIDTPVVRLVGENELRSVERLNEVEIGELINDKLFVAGLAIFERERHFVNVVGGVQSFERQVKFNARVCAECGQCDLTVQ